MRVTAKDKTHSFINKVSFIETFNKHTVSFHKIIKIVKATFQPRKKIDQIQIKQVEDSILQYEYVVSVIQLTLARLTSFDT